MNVHILDDSYVDATRVSWHLLPVQAEGGLEAVKLRERIARDAKFLKAPSKRRDPMMGGKPGMETWAIPCRGYLSSKGSVS